MKYFKSKKNSGLNFEHSTEYLTEHLNVETVFEAMDQSADLIELSYLDFLEVQKKLSFSDLDAYCSGAADSLIRIDNQYQFFQLGQKTFVKFLSQLKISLQVADFAVLIGDQLTISQFLPALNQLGYSRFVVVVEDVEAIQIFIQKIQRTFLGLTIEILNFKQISKIDHISSLLLVDIDHQSQAELVENLTYFNFLNSGSIFFDVRSLLSNELVQEAIQAQMFVIDALAYAEARLKFADQILTHKIK